MDRWLESLPLANMSAAGGELLAGLQELNHLRVSARFRLQTLERLTGPVLAVVGALDKTFQETAFPLSEKNDKVGRVAVQFFREMALGYRETANQLSGGVAKLSFINCKLGATCIHRALSALEQMLYRSSLLYQPVAPDVWGEIHTLYAFARQNGIHDRRFSDSMGWLKQEFSIDDVYKRLAIVGISDASRLSQRGIANIYRASELWSTRCEIIEAELLGENVSAHCFEIHVDVDMPPRLITHTSGENQPDFVFDVRRLKKWLKGVLEQSSDPLREIPFRIEGREPLILSAALLQQLVNTWAVRLERGYQRLPAQHEIKLIAGINGIHFNLCGEMTFEQFLDGVDDEGFAQTPEVLNNWAPAVDLAPQSTRTHLAQVLNQSLGGYCLRLVNLQDMHLRVGEIVSLCASSISAADAIWMIGVVRWLHAVGVDELEIGVSVVGQSARPAALMVPDQSARKVPPFRGLLINDFQASRATDQSLIVPSFFAKTQGEAIICYRQDSEMSSADLEFVELLERTTEFCRYRFSGLGSPDSAEIDGAGQSGDRDQPRSKMSA